MREDLNIDASTKRQIECCLQTLVKLFGEDLLGVYLYGSAIQGGLQKYSDIDIFVVLNRASSTREKEKLVAFLLEVSGLYMKGEKRPIELTIIEKGSVNPWRYPPQFDFQYGEWLREEFESGNLELWPNKFMPDLAILITQVMQGCEILFGKSPEEILCEVPQHDFTQAMTDEVPNLLKEIQSDTRNVLLTLARIWSTCVTNLIQPKQDAAAWAIKRLPEKYKPVLARARSIHQGQETEIWDDLQPLLKPCAEFIMQEVKRMGATPL